MIHVGFTGTRKGMTLGQRHSFLELFKKVVGEDNNIYFHHGDCVGADFDAHSILVGSQIEGLRIFIHPPIEDRLSAKAYKSFPHEPTTIYAPKPYIQRNRDIVKASDVVIAVPDGFDRKKYGGTWSTITYTEKNEKHLYIIYPNGSISESGE